MDSKNYLKKHKQAPQGLKESPSEKAEEKENKMSTFYRERIRNFFHIDNFDNTDDLRFIEANSHHAVEYLATMDEENFKELLLTFKNLKNDIIMGSSLMNDSWKNLNLLKEYNCFKEARKEFTNLEKLRERFSKMHQIQSLIRIASNLRCKLSKTNILLQEGECK